MSRVQNELTQAGLRLDSLNPKIKEAEAAIASLDERRNILNEQVGTLEAKLAEKTQLAKHLSELEKLGFDTERLKQLREALGEIGIRLGLKGKEAVGNFFDDLKDYESVLGAELQLKGLQTRIENKKLEAENWQAKEEALRRKHDDLKEALAAVHSLRTRGIKTGQIVTWHKILSRFQTVEEFEQSLAQYGDITKLLNARREETENCELSLTKTRSEVETLEKERTKLKGAIDALKVSWMKELKVMTGEASKQIKTLVDMEVSAIRTVGQEFRLESNDFITRLQTSGQKIFEMGQEYERMRQKLEKYEGVKDALESHLDASEGEK
jgi:chromosome segregation ATPase